MNDRRAHQIQTETVQAILNALGQIVPLGSADDAGVVLMSPFEIGVRHTYSDPAPGPGYNPERTHYNVTISVHVSTLPAD